jgi:hypothetical protein
MGYLTVETVDAMLPKVAVHTAALESATRVEPPLLGDLHRDRAKTAAIRRSRVELRHDRRKLKSRSVSALQIWRLIGGNALVRLVFHRSCSSF